MDSFFPFSEEEVRKKLAELGYRNISKEKMLIFMKDMEELVKYESSKNMEESHQSNTSATDDEDYFGSCKMRFKAFEKEKVNRFDSHNKENLKDTEKYETRGSFSTSSLSSTVMSDSNLDSSTASSVMRRKVARKKDGKFHVFDETFTETESEASDITIIEDRLRSLPLRDSYGNSSSNDDDGASIVSSASRKSEKHYLPSYIRPAHLQSNVNRTRKFDPVNRYHQFKEEWKLQSVPGENKHNSLRWNVREQMLNCETFEKPRHFHKPNSYEVPTGKKRQALRWEVRSALARM